MKKVVVFSTGGTIAMKMVPGKGVVPACSGADLVEAVPGLASVADIEVREFSNIPSCQMTPALMFSLAGQIRETLRRTTWPAVSSPTARTQSRKRLISSTASCVRKSPSR